MSFTYKDAGVNLEAGYESVNRMKKHVQKTMRKEVMGGLGAFGGMFDLSKLALKEPVLVSGTDGVGTKLKLAFMTDRHDTIGIDAVAMCVNDIIVQGAEPLFFLDYIACGKAEPTKIEAIVKGVADGCQQAGCTLIGGETAEMPGLYEEDEYDLAGFTVGAVEKQRLITGQHIQAGDVLIGLPSSGVHSNGFSLVRKLVFEKAALTVDSYIEELSGTVGEVLLTPTRIYVKPILKALEEYQIHGMAHVTGGGFYENLPRMLPEGLGVQIENGSWPILPVFNWLQSLGNIDEHEMFNVFNMGIGMVMAVRPEDAAGIQQLLTSMGEKSYTIGHVTAQTGVTFTGGPDLC